MPRRTLLNQAQAVAEHSPAWRRPLVLVFVLALGIRLAYVLFYPQQVVFSDPWSYDVLGWSLAQGFGYRLPGGAPDVYWAPGYPALLGAIYAVCGHSYVWIRVVQALLSALLVLLVGAMATRVFDKRTAFIAAMLCACYPGFIGYSGVLLTETLFTTQLAVIVLWLLAVHKDSSFRSLAGLGCVVGLTSLGRAEAVLLPLFVLVTLRLLFRDRTTTTARQLMVIYAAVVIVVVPWSVRNYAVTGEIIPLTVHDGDNIWIASYKGEWLEFHTDREPYRSLVAGLSQLERSRVLKREGIRNIVNDPAGYLWLCVKRFPRFWIGGHSNMFVGMEQSLSYYVERQQYGVVVLKLGMLGANLLLVVLGACGAYLAFTRRKGPTRSMVVIGAPVVYVTAIHCVFFAAPRYQIPIMPYVLLFAAVALDHVVRARLDARRQVTAVAS